MLKKLRKIFLSSVFAISCIGAYASDNSYLLRKSGDSEADIQFKTGDPNIDIEDSDLVRIKLGKNSVFKLEKRINKIPLLRIKGEYKIFQGSRAIKNLNGVITIDNPSDAEPEYEKEYDELRKKQGFVGSYRYTSSPMEIVFPKSKDVFFNGKSPLKYKIIFDNFNRMGIIPIEDDEGTEIYENIPIRFSNKSNSSFLSKEEIEKLIGREIIFDDSVKKGVRNLALGRLKDFWRFIPESSKELLKEINFPEQVRDQGLPYMGVAYFSGDIFLNPSSFSYTTFRHELSHISHYSLKRKYFEKIGRQDLVQRIDEHYARYFELSKRPRTFTVSNGRRGSYIYTDDGSRDLASGNELTVYSNTLQSDFESEWMKIAGDYDKIVRFEEEGAVLHKYQQDNQLSEAELKKLFARFNGKKWEAFWRPCFGYANAYGGINMQEDIATMTQMIASKPEHFKNIEDKRLVPVYIHKAKLLKENGFLRDGEYDGFLKVVEEK